MTLLSICQKVLAETGWPRLTSIASNLDGTAQQIFAIANTELEALSEMDNWPHLAVEYAFATVPAQTLYPMPLDCRVLSSEGVFNTSEYYQLKGSMGTQYWELLKYGKLGNLTRSKFRLQYPLGLLTLEMTPPPVTVENLVAVYWSNKYARDENNAPVPRYSADTDVSVVPERLVELGVKWRFRRAKGLDYSAELAEYNATVRTQLAKYAANGEIPVGGRRYFDDGLTPGYIPENGFGQ